MRITIRTKIQKRNELNGKIPNFRSELSKMCFKEDIRAKIKQKWNFYDKGQKFKLSQFLHTSRP